MANVRIIGFNDRTADLRRIRLGYEGDNLVERLEFDLPEITQSQTATLMITGADAVKLERTDEGRYAVDLTRDMIGPDGEREAYVRIDGAGEKVWQSAPMRMVTGALPDVEEEIEKVYPTAVGQMLTAMAEHSSEMDAQEERVEQAAQRAEDAAERAEAGGGGGGSGGSTVEIDTTLTQAGKAADAKATGDRLSELSKEKVDNPPVPSESKLRQYAELFNGTKEVESFLFFTDPHTFSPNDLTGLLDYEKRDLSLLHEYYKRTPTSFALCTGDWIDDGYTPEQACLNISLADSLMRTWFDRCCYAIGNHEYNDCGTGLLSKETVHNLLLRDKAKNYYIFDGDNTKIYVLDTGTLGYDVTEYGWEQIDWLADVLLKDDAKFSAIASHIWYVADSDGELVLTPFADAVLQLAQAYNTRGTVTLNDKAYSFVSATGRVEFAIGGHKHVDKVAEEYGMPVILTTNVTHNGIGKPIFDLVLADYTARKINLVRVGWGSSRVVALPARSNGLNYTNLVPTSVSPVVDEIYNGVGYKNNTVRKGSADQNYEGEKSGYVLTGVMDCFIPMYNTENLPTIYVKGNIETDETEYSSVVLWMDGKVRKGATSFVREANPQSGFTVERLADGYYKMTPTVRDDGRLEILVALSAGDVTGIQINLKGTGEGLIVTVNEPIE